MNYTFMPSLKHSALVKTAITLMNQTVNDVEDFITYQCILKVIKENAPKLQLPELLNNDLIKVVSAVGHHILLFKEYHEKLFGICPFKNNLDKLCWTSRGKIDKKKTAQILVQDESLDVIKRYNVACIYCLEDDINSLWKRLNAKKCDTKNLTEIDTIGSLLVPFWTHYVQGEIDHFNYMTSRYRAVGSCTTHYEFLLCQSAIQGNEAAIRYFLKKLTPEEKEKMLVKIAQGAVAAMDEIELYELLKFRMDNVDDHSDVLCFLLSQMSNEQQLEVYETNPYAVLSCLLSWPWQGFYMETAKRMWTFLEKDVEGSIRTILQKYEYNLDYEMTEFPHCLQDYNYQELLKQFYQQSPDAFKEMLLREMRKNDTLKYLFSMNQQAFFLILIKAPVKDKEEIIFSFPMHVWELVFLEAKWDILKSFVEECLGSKDALIRFKVVISKYIKNPINKEKLNHGHFKNSWHTFCRILDDLIQKHSKKHIGEAGSCPTKRLCTGGFEQAMHMEKDEKVP